MKDHTLLRFTRTCQMCGKVMHNVAPNKKLCPDCQKSKKIERDKEHDAKKAAETAPYRKPFPRRAEKTRKMPDYDSIGAVCARAEEAGRTYGQQVEWERRRKELISRGEIDQK